MKNLARWFGKVTAQVASAIAVLGVSTAFALAQQEWPSRPIRLIIPGSPGGGTDVLGRLIAKPVSDALGQPVILDNKTGAGGNVGAEAAAQSAPDGYTFFLTTTSPHGVGPTLYKNLRFDAIKDFSGVARLCEGPLVVVVRSDFPAKTVNELVAFAKANPDKINYSSPGSGSLAHLVGAMFAKEAGIKVVHVPYRSTSFAVQALLAGEVQLGFESPHVIIEHIKAGKLRPLAVTTPTRWTDLPDVPTMKERGFADFEATNWFGVVAPAKTPPVVLERMAAAIGNALSTPSMRERFQQLGVAPAMQGPKEFESFYKEEIARWAPIVRASGAKVD